MAPSNVDEQIRREEPQEIDFAEFEEEKEEFGGFDEESVKEDEKDSTEEELERLVFGDSAGFRASLKKSKQLVKTDAQLEDAGEDGTGLEDAQDADVGSMCPEHDKQAIANMRH